jgi:hypothetical protein
VRRLHLEAGQREAARLLERAPCSRLSRPRRALELEQREDAVGGGREHLGGIAGSALDQLRAPTDGVRVRAADGGVEHRPDRPYVRAAGRIVERVDAARLVDQPLRSRDRAVDDRPGLGDAALQPEQRLRLPEVGLDREHRVVRDERPRACGEGVCVGRTPEPEGGGRRRERRLRALGVARKTVGERAPALECERPLAQLGGELGYLAPEGEAVGSRVRDPGERREPLAPEQPPLWRPGDAQREFVHGEPRRLPMLECARKELQVVACDALQPVRQHAVQAAPLLLGQLAFRRFPDQVVRNPHRPRLEDDERPVREHGCRPPRPLFRPAEQPTRVDQGQRPGRDHEQPEQPRRVHVQGREAGANRSGRCRFAPGRAGESLQPERRPLRPPPDLRRLRPMEPRCERQRQLDAVVLVERPERQLEEQPACQEGTERRGQRLRLGRRPACAHEQQRQPRRPRRGDEIVEQRERLRIPPLHVVDDHRERSGPFEATKRRLEDTNRLELGTCGRLPEQELLQARPRLIDP